jgi:hypothetical protein
MPKACPSAARQSRCERRVIADDVDLSHRAYDSEEEGSSVIAGLKPLADS